jgi:uncharacterized protein YgbK (DUF1537 family)
VLIVADDLTGAADSAGAFAAAGLSAVVVLSESGPAASGEATNADVVSIDTNGRSLDEDGAFLATATAVRASAHRPVFVKIDSTLRGHVRSTVLAVLSALQTPPKRVVVCPAFPALGRTVVDAEVHVDGVPIMDGNLREVLRGFPADAGLFIPAVRSDEDLAAVVHRMHDPDHPADTLWVGSAGLAHHLAPHQRALTTSAHRGVTVERAAASRIAVVVGSQHERTIAQLAALDIAAQTATNSQVFRIDPSDQEFIEQILPTLLKADALVLTGGRTARAVLDALGVKHLTVGGEVEIGMPWATAVVATEDGSHPIALITKAGGFGDELALRRAAEFLYNP